MGGGIHSEERIAGKGIRSMEDSQALITSDAVVLGLLAVVLGVIFLTAQSDRPFWRKFYTYVPSLLLCFFIPSLFNTFGVIDADRSNLYYVASHFLLPSTLVLLALSIDLPGIMRLGPKALVMFLTATAGIVVGGPLAIMVFRAVDPEIVGGIGSQAVWRGMTTIAGSWIGGAANQTAMKEVFQVSDDLFSAMVTVDVLASNVWLAVLLYLAGKADAIDRKIGADTSALVELREKVEEFHEKHARIPTLTDLMAILAVGFGVSGLSHLIADWLAPYIAQSAPFLDRFSLTSQFFWLIVFATTGGLILSFTRARELEGVGASKVGSAMLYILVATIGMGMDLGAILERPGLFAVGGVWMLFHAGLLLIVAYLIRAPVFYMAVGSQANVGGAASAPIVASAFHPTLAPVGVLLAVLGYALGTYAAWLCGQLMQVVAP